MSEQLISSTSCSADNLFAGGVQRAVTGVVTLKAGLAYTRGTVVGLITAEDKAVAADSTKTDGSERPNGILTDDVDATMADVITTVYLTGEFNEAALTFGGTDTADDHKQTLRDIGIFLKSNVKA
ncbi:head decoration protein [Tumebacillus permanentifrigoris]|uniref:Bacteriophage lambda head decoration protein D n=1 Tax=Tumebacillus permanentifrigoris TaxID=378543 RepID=A0A316DFR0_9BACL|nr:head decoration protein [Tumebacillus permanentifrigoris]PWK16069.1 bacteriophage lambda head decoration protein D [Tumebacillus permanentifrigoris]